MFVFVLFFACFASSARGAAVVRGSRVFADSSPGTTTAPLPVRFNTTAVFFSSQANGGATPATAFVTAEMTPDANIIFRRDGTGVTLTTQYQALDLWQLPSVFRNPIVERGTLDYDFDTLEASVPLQNTFDLSRAFPIVTWTSNSSKLGADVFWGFEFRSATELLLSRAQFGSSGAISWQVVGWDAGSSASVTFLRTNSAGGSLDVFSTVDGNSLIVSSSYLPQPGSSVNLANSFWRQSISANLSTMMESRGSGGLAMQNNHWILTINEINAPVVGICDFFAPTEISNSVDIGPLDLTFSLVLVSGFRGTAGTSSDISSEILQVFLRSRLVTRNVLFDRSVDGTQIRVCAQYVDFSGTQTTTSTSAAAPTSSTLAADTTSATALPSTAETLTTTSSAPATQVPVNVVVPSGSTSTQTSFSGNVTFQNASKWALGVSGANIDGILTIESGVSLQITGFSGAAKRVMLVTAVTATGGIVGQFESVIASPANPDCQTASASAAYSSTTLTITTDFEDECMEGGGLSSGAIAGIAVGASVAVLVIVGAIVGALLHRRRTNKSLQNMQFKLNTVN